MKKKITFLAFLFVLLFHNSLFSQYVPGAYKIYSGSQWLVGNGPFNLPVCDNETNITIYANDPSYSGGGGLVNYGIVFVLYKNGQAVEGIGYCNKSAVPYSDDPAYRYKYTFKTTNIQSGTYYVGVELTRWSLGCQTDMTTAASYNTNSFSITCGYEDAGQWTAGLANPNAPANCAGNILMSSNSTQIFYRGTDSKIHSIWYSGGAQYSVLNNNVSNVAGDLALSPNNQTIYYRGTDGKLNYLQNSSGVWNWGVLSNSITNVAGDIVVSPNGQSVYYRGTDGKLNFFWYNNNQWNWGVLSNSVTNVAGDICVKPNGNDIYYRGTDSKLYLFYYSGGWQWGVVRNDITNVSGQIRHTPTTGYVNYRGTDGKLYWVNYNGGWQKGVLSNSVNDITREFLLSTNSDYVNYLASDNRIKYLQYLNGGWNGNSYIKYRYNNIVGDLFSNADGSIIVARGSDGKIYRFIAPNTTAPFPNGNEFSIDPAKYNTTLANPQKQALSVSPNPANNSVVIRWNTDNASNSQLQIMDSRGSLKLNRILPNFSSMNTFTVDLNGWSKGLYFIRVVGGTKETRTKLIIQ